MSLKPAVATSAQGAQESRLRSMPGERIHRAAGFERNTAQLRCESISKDTIRKSALERPKIDPGAEDARIAVKVGGHVLRNERVVADIDDGRPDTQAKIAGQRRRAAGIDGCQEQRVGIGKILAVIRTATGDPRPAGIAALQSLVLFTHGIDVREPDDVFLPWIEIAVCT